MSFFKDNLITGPECSPMYKPLPRFYNGYRKLSVFCLASPEGIAKSLPPELEYVGPMIEVFIVNAPEVRDLADPVMGPRRFIEGGVAVQARYKDKVGGHVLYEFMNTDDGITCGREIWGYPKKMAELSYTESESGAIESQVVRQGRMLIDVRFKPDASASVEKPVLQPRYQVKRIPRADGQGYDVHQIVRNELIDPVLHHTVKGTAVLHLGGSHHMDPLFELGVQKITGAEFSIGDFTLGYGTIHADLLAK